MKVLKQGTLPKDKIYEVVCYNCTSLLQFKRSEGKITYSQRDGNSITVICPVCKCSVSTDLKN